MKTVIYYFSATGNSLMVAQGLADKLTLTDVISIASADCNKNLFAERIGLVFPVYLWGVPNIMVQFINSLTISSATKIFAVATYRSQPSGVLRHLQHLVKRRGFTLTAGFQVQLPSNNIIYYDAASDETIHAELKEWESQLDTISTMLRNDERPSQNKTSVLDLIKLNVLRPPLVAGFHHADKNFWVTASCNGCGLCKNICPVGNIEIEWGKPMWQHRCEQCTACLNLCPNDAIEYSKFTAGKKRYKNPTVNMKDLINRQDNTNFK